jgi:hypothetical protein
VGGKVGRSVPALQHGSDREPVVLTDGDEPALADEGVDLGLIQAAIVDVHPHGVAGQEQMRGIPVELGTLMRSQGVFHGQLVQAELTGQRVELLLGGGTQIYPYHGVGLVEVLRDVGDGKALGLERALAVHPGPGIAHDIPSPPQRLHERDRSGRPGRLCLVAYAVAPGGCLSQVSPILDTPSGSQTLIGPCIYQD